MLLAPMPPDAAPFPRSDSPAAIARTAASPLRPTITRLNGGTFITARLAAPLGRSLGMGRTVQVASQYFDARLGANPSIGR
ncbi:hypothetical protein ABIC44_000660 [Sphingomonas sp. 1185]